MGINGVGAEERDILKQLSYRTGQADEAKVPLFSPWIDGKFFSGLPFSFLVLLSLIL